MLRCEELRKMEDRGGSPLRCCFMLDSDILSKSPDRDRVGNVRLLLLMDFGLPASDDSSRSGTT